MPPSAEASVGSALGAPTQANRWLILSLPVAAAVAYAVLRYPLGNLVLLALLITYAYVLYMRPQLWLLFFPLLLPVLDLSPLTGRFFFDEFDFLVLVTWAMCIWRLPGTKLQRLPQWVSIVFALYALSYVISLIVGALPLAGFDINSFSNYYSKYNGLRVGKALLEAWLLLTLYQRTMDSAQENQRRLLVPGLVLGLAVVGAVGVWERFMFTDLANFSTEYRITSTFASMHIGGGGIDGYLALAVPFAIGLMLQSRNWIGVLVGAALFALGTYTVLVTFGRGLYLAYGLSLALFTAALLLRNRPRGGAGYLRALTLLALLPLLAYLFFQMFRAGGFRTLGAALMFAAAAYVVGGDDRPVANKLSLIGAVIAAMLLSALMVRFVPKGAYVMFAVSAFALMLGLILRVMSGGARGTWSMAAALIWMGFNVAVVGLHWGGRRAFLVAFAAVLVIGALTLVNRYARAPLWRLNAEQSVIAALLAVVVLGALPVVSQSYFVSERAKLGGGDLQKRIDHWGQVYRMMDDNARAAALGMGLGRFPEIYFWRNLKSTSPATYQFMNQVGNTFLRLGGPSHDRDPALIFFGQHVPVRPGQRYALSLDARPQTPNVGLELALCEQIILYSGECVKQTIPIPDIGQGWRRVTVNLDSARLGSWQGLGRKPVRLYFGNGNVGSFVDVDNVALIGPNGKNLLANPDFTHGMDRWFFTASNFWPWRVENSWLSVLFEQGWVGVSLLVVLVLGAIGKNIAGAIRGDNFALTRFVALSAFAAVGSFNSMFEFPRVALLFYFLVLISLLVPTQPAAAPSSARRIKSAEEAFPGLQRRNRPRSTA